MSNVTGFKPLSNPAAKVLILGSAPGAASLKYQQYYALPRNGFWPIMASIAGFDASAHYDKRVAALTNFGVALWDVLHSCIRPGSLDSSIQREKRVYNKFAEFFDQHPCITLVCFNGAEAEKSFEKNLLPNLDIQNLRRVRLPSTSPAHAVSFEDKLQAWKAELGPHLGG